MTKIKNLLFIRVILSRNHSEKFAEILIKIVSQKSQKIY